MENVCFVIICYFRFQMSVPTNQPSHVRQCISQLSRFTTYIIKRKDTGQEEGFAFLDRNYETIPCLEEWQLELFDSAEVEKDKSKDVEPFQLSGPSVFSTPSIKLPHGSDLGVYLSVCVCVCV